MDGNPAMRTLLTLIFLVGGVVGPGVRVWGDVVYLKDGRVLRGIIQRGPEGYVVTTEDGRRQVVPADQVKSMEVTADPADEQGAMRGLASLRRAVESMEDIGLILQRYRRFVDQHQGTAAAQEAMKDIELWEGRQARGMVKFAGRWVMPGERDEAQRLSLDLAQRGMQLLKQGRLTEAEPVLREALGKDPENVTAIYLRALLLARQDQWVAARKLLEQAIVLVPDHVPTMNNLAVVLWRQKQPAAALVWYDRAMVASPENKQILNNVAEAMNELPQEVARGEAARKTRQRFEAQDRRLQAELEPMGWYRWGATWVNRGQLDELREVERRIQERLDELSARFDETQAEIRRADEDMEINARSMRQIEANSYVRDAEGNFIAIPYPPIYYDLQRDNAGLLHRREQAIARLQELKKAAQQVQKQLPVPRYTGMQQLFGPEGAPMRIGPAPAPATAPSTQAGGSAAGSGFADEQFGEFGDVDLDGFLDARIIQGQAGFIAVGLDHQFQRVSEVSAALIEGFAAGDGSGDFFHPTHKPPVGIGFDDGVILLSHDDAT